MFVHLTIYLYSLKQMTNKHGLSGKQKSNNMILYCLSLLYCRLNHEPIIGVTNRVGDSDFYFRLLLLV